MQIDDFENLEQITFQLRRWELRIHPRPVSQIAIML